MITTHFSRVHEYLSKGYVIVEERGECVDVVNSEHTCVHPVRGADKATGPVLCLLDKDHRGHHSSVVYWCDGCGKARRGRPHAENEHVQLCFMCVREII